MHNPFLIGDTIYLRPIERDDAAVIQPWVNDADVTRTLRRNWPMSRHAEEAFIESLAKDEHRVCLMIVLKEGDRPIGVCGLNDSDPVNRHAARAAGTTRSAWGCCARNGVVG